MNATMPINHRSRSATALVAILAVTVLAGAAALGGLAVATGQRQDVGVSLAVLEDAGGEPGVVIANAGTSSVEGRLVVGDRDAAAVELGPGETAAFRFEFPAACTGPIEVRIEAPGVAGEPVTIPCGDGTP